MTQFDCDNFADYLLHEASKDINLTNVDRILDIGCGNGSVTFAIQNRLNCEVIGIDTCEQDIDEARRNFQSDKHIFKVGDGFDLSFLKQLGKFDLILLIGSRVTDLSIINSGDLKKLLESYKFLLNERGMILIQENSNLTGQKCKKTGWILKTNDMIENIYGDYKIHFFVKRNGFLDKKIMLSKTLEIFIRKILKRYISFVVLVK